MTRVAPLCLAGLLCAGATQCAYLPLLPLVHTSPHVLGRATTYVWEGPDLACPSEWTGLDDSYGLEHRLWLEIAPEAVSPYQVVRPDGWTAQPLSSAHGWQTLWAPVTLASWFVTKPVRPTIGAPFRGYFIQAYGEWGDCRPWNTAPCHYVRVDPTPGSAGGFHDITAGWVVRATGQACTTYWPSRNLECVDPGVLYPADDWCWLPQNSTWSYEGLG